MELDLTTKPNSAYDQVTKLEENVAYGQAAELEEYAYIPNQASKNSDELPNEHFDSYQDEVNTTYVDKKKLLH